jgi:mycofactocin glycosyltransferase
LPPIQPDNGEESAVDIVIPVYGERSEALDATLIACVNQSYPVSRVFVVDDGSPEPVSLPEWALSSPQICLLRLPDNRGISAARNAAIALSKTKLLACINTEVLPNPDWLETCTSYLGRHPEVGSCYTRTLPKESTSILTRWRMRFQEPLHVEVSGPAVFAHGHAVLFRRQSIDAVGGYDVRYRRHSEDSDICERMRSMGWTTHYIATSRCVSIQHDSIQSLAAKQLRDSGWESPNESSLAHLYTSLTYWTAVRAGRNLLRFRWYFIPIDIAIWSYALWLATRRTLRQ